MSNAWPYWCAPSWFSEIELSGEILILKFPSAIDVMWLSPEWQICTHTSLPCCTPECCGPSEAETSAAFLLSLGAHTGDSCYLSCSSCTHSSCTATPPRPSHALQDWALIQDRDRVKQNRRCVQDVFCFHHNILKVRECMRLPICCNLINSLFFCFNKKTTKSAAKYSPIFF